MALRIVGLTVVAMAAFAANSVLARLALAAGQADALGYTGIRLAAGAAMMGAILWAGPGNRHRSSLAGSWSGAAALFGYALAFSVAYLMLGAGTGALILFASVQFGMLAWAVLKGDRPGLLEWAGIAIAVAALVGLVSPGLVAPDPLGAVLMVASGLSWAAYTLIGRGSRAPLADTAGNFIRCLPLGIGLIAAGLAHHPIDARTAALAMVSGALASGLGYAVWYAVLPALTRTTAALVQLTVPSLAAAGGVVVIGEPLTGRLVLASVGILGGVALALFGAERRKSLHAG